MGQLRLLSAQTSKLSSNPKQGIFNQPHPNHPAVRLYNSTSARM
jgi:hypothetical protein